jgi:hypothetical protein
MKHIVDASAIRQLKVIGHRAHVVQHLIQPGILGAKLPAGTGHQGLSWVMKQTQPHPVPDDELQSLMMCVVVPESVLPRLKQTGAYLSEESVAVGQHGVNGVGASATQLVKKQGRRCLTVDHCERRRA